MDVKSLSQNVRPARAKSVLIAAALLVWILAPTGAQAILAPGEPAPSFSLESGNNKKLTLDMLKGKVVVLFYATRDTIEVNEALSRYLDRVYAAQPQNIQNQIYRLLVLNAMEAAAVTTWKEKLNETSEKMKITIYGDWTGSMFVAYRMRDDDSNFVIIDKKGVVRFSASGKVANSRFEAIKKLISELVTGK
jgi:hypothetical protein